MIKINLKNNKILEFQNPCTIWEVIESIKKSLKKDAICASVNGKMVDLDFLVKNDAKIEIYDKNSKQGIEVLRHSCAHLLANAVLNLYEDVEISIGPVIENGFYYDFLFTNKIHEEDLVKIEQKMHDLAKENYKTTRKVVKRDEALNFFKKQNQNLKIKILQDIPENEELTLYNQGKFTDLCRGPHVPFLSYIKYFKLTKISGAYFKGNSKNQMLTRIYGVCFSNKEDLLLHLKFLEEAKERDHRKIGLKQNLFHFQEESPGIAFWHPKGVAIWKVVEEYLRESNKKYGCLEIKTPLIANLSLWEKSGHKDKFLSNMFLTESEKTEFAIRPMNCPTCIQVYNSYFLSYKDLPIRFTEFGLVHRNEYSGALHGLLRVRSFTQDDGHIFCTKDMLQEEVLKMIKQCFEVYEDFGFKNIALKLALRPKERIGSDEIWDEAEESLKQSLIYSNKEFEILKEEGAFYGPKIEFHLKDAIGRSWQCGTIQMDFSMPERLNCKYIDKDGKKATPVMLHRAIVGSIERFIGILIEEYKGKFPVWLAPFQVSILTISEKFDEYANNIYKKLYKLGIRVKIDLRNDKIGFKIRNSILEAIPFIIIIGEQEQKNNNISVRYKNGNNENMGLDDFIKIFNNEILKKCK